MPDCGKTEVFLKERKRMCDTHTLCHYCDIGKHRVFGDLCRNFCAENAEVAISIVQKWSDEHPQKSYAEVFLGKFPKQHIEHTNPEWRRRICRTEIFGGVCKHGGCEKCWNEPYDEGGDSSGS